jgi:hypothetical protein
MGCSTCCDTSPPPDVWQCLKYKTYGWEGWCTEYGWIYNDNGFMLMTETSPPDDSNTLSCRNNSYNLPDYYEGARLDFWLSNGTANVMLYYGTRRLTEAGGTNQIHYSTSDPAVINALAAGDEVDVSTWTSSITQGAPRAKDGRSYIDTVGTVLIRFDPVPQDSGGSSTSAQQAVCDCGFWPGAFRPTCSSNATPVEECYPGLPETFTLQFQPAAFTLVSAGGLTYGDIDESNPPSTTVPPWILPTGDVLREVGTADEYNAGSCGSVFARFQQPIVLRKTLTGADTTYVSDPLPLRPCTKILYKLTVHKGDNYSDRRATLSSATTTGTQTPGGTALPKDGPRLVVPGFGCQWDKDYWADNPSEHEAAFNGKVYSFFHGQAVATPGGVYTPETIVTCPNSATSDSGYSYSSNCMGQACPPSEYIVRLSQPTSGGTLTEHLWGDYYVPAQTNPRYCRVLTGFREWVPGAYYQHQYDASNVVSLYLNFGYHSGSTFPPVLSQKDGCGCGQMGPFLRISGTAKGTAFDTNAPRLPAGVGSSKQWPASACASHCNSTDKTIDFGDVNAQIAGPAFPAVFNVQVIIPAVLP